MISNGEHVHPLPASGEDELGVDIQVTIDAASTAAGSGLHDADCWASDCVVLGCGIDTLSNHNQAILDDDLPL